MKRYSTLRVAALSPGDEISALEGVDLAGEKAVVVELAPGSSGTTVVTLLFPRLKASKRYEVSNSSLSSVSADPPRKQVPTSVIDSLRASDPDRTVPPIRDGVPDTFFPPDVNGTQPTMTDVLWRPTVRRTPFTKGLQAGAQSRYGAEAAPEEGDQFYLLVDILPFASFSSNKSKDERSEIAQKKEFKGKLERGLEKAFSGKKDLSYRLKYVGTKNQKEYHVFVTFNSQKAYNLGVKTFITVQDYWAPEDTGLNMVLYKVGPIKDGKMSVSNERSKPVYAAAAAADTVLDTYPATMPPPRDRHRPMSSSRLDSGYSDGSPRRPRSYNRPYEVRYLRSQHPVVDLDQSMVPSGGWKRDEPALQALAELFLGGYKEMQLTKLPGLHGHGNLDIETWAIIFQQEGDIETSEMEELWQYMVATRQITATAYRAWRDRLRHNMLWPVHTPNSTSTNTGLINGDQPSYQPREASVRRRALRSAPRRRGR